MALWGAAPAPRAARAARRKAVRSTHRQLVRRGHGRDGRRRVRRALQQRRCSTASAGHQARSAPCAPAPRLLRAAAGGSGCAAGARGARARTKKALKSEACSMLTPGPAPTPGAEGALRAARESAAAARPPRRALRRLGRGAARARRGAARGFPVAKVTCARAGAPRSAAPGAAAGGRRRPGGTGGPRVHHGRRSTGQERDNLIPCATSASPKVFVRQPAPEEAARFP